MLESKSIDTAFELIKNDPTKVLGLRVGGKDISPGLYIPRSNTQDTPQISFMSTPEKTYIVIGLDVDAPFQSWGGLGPVLHWRQSGFKSDPTTGQLSTSVPFITNWIASSPPPGSGPHRYIFLLYEEPAGFDVSKFASPGGKKVGNWPRVRYNLSAFEKEAKLGPVLAMNYYTSN